MTHPYPKPKEPLNAKIVKLSDAMNRMIENESRPSKINRDEKLIQCLYCVIDQIEKEQGFEALEMALFEHDYIISKKTVYVQQESRKFDRGAVVRNYQKHMEIK